MRPGRFHSQQTADLDGARSSPGLLAAVRDVATRTATLLAESARLAPAVADRRLRMEVAVIQRLAERILARLKVADPLADRVHLSRAAMAGTALQAIVQAGLFAPRRAPAATGRED